WAPFRPQRSLRAKAPARAGHARDVCHKIINGYQPNRDWVILVAADHGEEKLAMIHRKQLLTALALWLFAGTALAADIRGVIAKVDLKQNELVVEALTRRARGLTFVFHLDDRTTVRLNGEPGKLPDLAAGQRVRVDYDLLRDGQRVARSVRI